MAEVKHFIDQQSIQGDADLIKGILDDVLIKLEKIKKVKIDLSGLKSFGSAGDAAKQLERTLNELNRAQEKLATTNAKLAKSAQALANQKNAESKLRQQEVRELEQISRQQEKILKQQAQEVKQLEKNNNAYTQLIEKQKIAGAASLKRGAELLKEAKGNDQLFISLLKTDKAYLESSKSAKNLNDQLLLLEQNIGRNQRNVGNYASAYNGLQRQFGLIANELPSLTISVQQFALALSNNLPLAAEEIRNTQREIKQLQAEGKPTPSLFQKLTSAVFSFQVGISIVVTLLVAFSGQIVKFIKDLNGSSDALDRATASINKFAADARASAANLQFLNTELDNYITLLTESNSLLAGGDLDTLRAELQISFQKEANAVTTAKEAWQDYLGITDQITKLQTEGEINPITGNISIPEVPKEDLDKLKTQEDETVKIYQDANAKVADEKFKQQLLILRINNQKIKDEEDFKKKLKDLQDKRLKELQDNARSELQARREARLLALKEDADFQKSIIDNEGKSYQDRITAANNFQLVQDAIAESERNFALQDLEKKRIEIGLSEQQVQEQRLLIIDKFNAAILQNTRTNTDQIIAINKEQLEEVDRLRTEYEQKEIKRIEDRLNREKNLLNKERDEQLLDVESQFSDGLISRAQYELEKERIQNEFNTRALQAELAFYDSMVVLLKSWGADTTAIEAKIAETRLKIKQVGNAKEIKTEEERVKELKRLRQELAQEIINFGEALVLGRFDEEKNRIQEQINLIEEKKRKEIEAINATTLSALEKSARITNAEKKAQVERERLEFRQRQIDIQRAKFERAFSIAQVVAKTAEAIAKAVAANPLTGGLPFSAIAAAIGALQIATILAKPIPKFKKGKGQYDQYEGPAWVGDGGKSEMIFREDGAIEKTPSTPVMTWVGKNDIIHPDADALLNSTVKKQGDKYGYQAPVQFGFQQMTDTLKSELQTVASAIRNKREWQVSISNEGATVKTKDGNRTKEYLNRNLQFGK